MVKRRKEAGTSREEALPGARETARVAVGSEWQEGAPAESQIPGSRNQTQRSKRVRGGVGWGWGGMLIRGVDGICRRIRSAERKGGPAAWSAGRRGKPDEEFPSGENHTALQTGTATSASFQPSLSLTLCAFLASSLSCSSERGCSNYLLSQIFSNPLTYHR